MYSNAWVQVKDLIRDMRKELPNLDRSRAFDITESAWRNFVSHIGDIYFKLEAGSKGDPLSRAWLSEKKQERLDDPMLYYLYIARDNRHSAKDITKRVEGQFFTLGKGVYLGHGELKTSTQYNWVVGADGTPKK